MLLQETSPKGKTDRMDRARLGFTLFYSGLILMAAGLPLSMFIMSVSQFVMAAGWLAYPELGNRIKKAFSNKFFWLFASIFLMHLIGLIYTEDFDFASRDLRVKIPLLLLPLLICGGPDLSKKQFDNIVWVFISAVVISSLISFATLLGLTGQKVTDHRLASSFISHIRLALLVCLASFLSFIYSIRAWADNRKISILFMCSSVWLFSFLFALQSITGIVVFVIVAIISSAIFYRKKYAGLGLTTLLLSGIIIAYGIKLFQEEIDLFYTKQSLPENLELSTVNGNKYDHNIMDGLTENGNYLGAYVCVPELSREWMKRSNLPYNGVDLKGQKLEHTIIRYATSKGLRKDSIGINSLTEEDIRNIESGETNALYAGSLNVRRRIHQLVFEADVKKRGYSSEGHTTSMRLDAWKFGLEILKNNMFVGIGTGDIDLAFKKKYKEASRNNPKWQLRSHNQYLSIGICFGVIGLAIFLCSIFIPMYRSIQQPNTFYLIFLLIAVISMTVEDTLETQAGVSFFAFFNSLFWFALSRFKSSEEPKL